MLAKRQLQKWGNKNKRQAIRAERGVKRDLNFSATAISMRNLE
jgi:hypothetical protein